MKPKNFWSLMLLLSNILLTQSILAEPVDPFGITPSTGFKSYLVKINYAKASNLTKIILVQHQNLFSATGVILADDRTNQIWLKDDDAHAQTLLQLLHALDIPQQQIRIKAKIMTVDEEYARTLGLKLINQTGTTVPTSTDNSITLTIAHLEYDNYLMARIQALENSGHAELISNPQLITSNRQSAVIESGEDVPYQQATGNGNTNVAFKKAVLRLEVQPITMPQQKLLLNISVSQDKVSNLTVQGVPAINTQHLTTQVLVADQQTIILGGIYENSTSDQVEGIPLLDKLPLLGFLFQTQQHSLQRRELLIFVTPEIERE